MPDIKLREERVFPLLPLPPQNPTAAALRDWCWAVTRELQKYFAGGGFQTQQIMFREDGRTVTDHDGHYAYTSAGTTVIEKSIFKSGVLEGEGDADFSSVKLLLHCDGTNGSTTFTDVKGHTVTTHGNAQISTAQSKFGGASGLFDGSGDTLSLAAHSDWDISTGDWTIEGWIRVGALGCAVVSRRSGSTSGWVVQIHTDGSVIFRASIGGTWSDFWMQTAASVISINTWHHVAWVRNGNTFYTFVDGVQKSTMTNSNAISNESSQPLRIGVANQLAEDYYNGYLDDIRITKGVARYTANFTPPTEAFPDSGEGDVLGPSSATDNVWARFDGATGKRIQNGLWTEADSGAVSAGGALAMQDNVISRPELKDYAETSTSANSGTSLSFSLENGNVFQVLMTGNCTFTFNNPPADGKAGSFTVLLKQDGTGSRTATWPAAVKWAGGTAPTLTTTANKTDILTFITRNAGTDWYGFVGGKSF